MIILLAFLSVVSIVSTHETNWAERRKNIYEHENEKIDKIYQIFVAQCRSLWLSSLLLFAITFRRCSGKLEKKYLLSKCSARNIKTIEQSVDSSAFLFKLMENCANFSLRDSLAKVLFSLFIFSCDCTRKLWEKWGFSRWKLMTSSLSHFNFLTSISFAPNEMKGKLFNVDE